MADNHRLFETSGNYLTMEQNSKIVLLVDDEKKFLDAISKRLKLMGLTALAASSGQDSIELAQENIIDLAIVDLNMPDMDGLVTIAKLKEIQPEIRTVLLTGHGNQKVKQAAEALHAKYFEKENMKSFWDFVKKMSHDLGVIVVPPPTYSDKSMGQDIYRSDNLGPPEMEIRRSQSIPGDFSNPLGTHATDYENYYQNLPKLVGETPDMQELKKNIARAAVMDSPVLLYGEVGTGKELAARMIHSRSRRKIYGFMAVNCSAFSRSLLAHEIWGHENVSSRGIVHKEAGLFETAHGGTILLDDIESIPLKMQEQLLRLLRDKIVVPQGGIEEIPVDIRIMAATTGNLKKKVNDGRVREDLYRRLNTFELKIPPLRERRDDIAPLCSYFLNKFSKEYNKEVRHISEEALSVLMPYPFPGNVGELESLIERAVILADDETIERKHLPKRFQGIDHSTVHESRNFMTLAELEEQYILEVLEATGGSRLKTVEILGISRAALWRKLKRFKENQKQH